MGIPGVELSTIKDLLKKISDNNIVDIGAVRHPKRFIKIFGKRLPIPYILLKKDNVSKMSEADLRKETNGKWACFDDGNNNFYSFDPTTAQALEKEVGGDKICSRDYQQKNYGAFGFVKIDDKRVQLNTLLDKQEIEGKSWKIINIENYLLNCSFGYNYEQPAMGVQISIANDRGQNQELVRSGDMVRIYMWYDRPSDTSINIPGKPKVESFASRVEAWKNNIDIDKEDGLFTEIQQYFSLDDAVKDKDKPVIKKHQVVLMFTGIIDGVSYEYSKDQGNKIDLQGRSLGSVLSAARIYKSYPLEGRLTMPHEEIIADIIKQQSGLSFNCLVLDKPNYAAGCGVIPEGEQRSLVHFNDFKTSSGGKDLNKVTAEQLQTNMFERFASSFNEGIRKSKLDVQTIDSNSVEGLWILNKSIITDIGSGKKPTAGEPKKDSKGEPVTSKIEVGANGAQEFNLKEKLGMTAQANKKTCEGVSKAEMDGKGSCSPIWVYSDGKTGKDNNGGYSETHIDTIIRNLADLNRKTPVLLDPVRWAEYGIKVPPILRRPDGALVTPVALFFKDGWNATKYVIQERAINVSTDRAAMIYALMNCEDLLTDGAKILAEAESFAHIKADIPERYTSNTSSRYFIYQCDDVNFNPIDFMVKMKVLNAVPKNGGTDGEQDPRLSEIKKVSKTKENKQTAEKPEDVKMELLESALNEQSITYIDAKNRMKIFYDAVRHLCRTFHDIQGKQIPRAIYPNVDSIQAAITNPSGRSNYAIEFPVVYKGQLIVLPKDILNAPRKWRVKAEFTANADNTQWTCDLKTKIKEITDEGGTSITSLTGGDAFKYIVGDGESTDAIEPGTILTGEKGTNNGVVGADWQVVINFSKGYDKQPNPSGDLVIFTIIEEAKLIKSMRKDSKDLIFEGETVFEAVKKITDKYFDIVQYVDEYGFYNVRPRTAYKLAGQDSIYTITAAEDSYPKLINLKSSENSSQTINKVVLLAMSPGISEVVIVTVEDRGSISKFGIKQIFEKVDTINNSLDAIKRAKQTLLTNRMKLQQVEVTCEPIFDLRPGHIVQVLSNNASFLSGYYIVDQVGINYSKNGGAVQTFQGYSLSDIGRLDDLTGQVAYYEKVGDTLILQKQESDIRKAVDQATT